MSGRLPYAARQLIEQVQSQKKRAKAEPFGDPDGLRVVRTIKFDKTTSKWLAPILEQLDDDRLVETETTEAGYLHVTFSPGPNADDRRPFPLAEAAALVE